MLRLNTSERIKFILIDSLGAPKTGLVAASFKASSVYLYKADGTKTTIALTLGVNLFETDSTDGPGIYEVILTTTHTNTLGPLAVSIQPAAADFVATYITETVEDTVGNIATLIGTPVVSVSTDIASVYSRLGAPAGASISADIAAVKVDTAATVAKLPASTISSATDITSAITSIKGISTIDNTQIYNRIGTPTGASVSIDIANVLLDTANILVDTNLIKLDTAATVAKLPATTISSAADVVNAVTSIKGVDNRSITDIAGVGTFNLATDTLHDIRTAISGFATTADVTAARDSIKGPDSRDLTQMAGAGFVSATHSLVALKNAITAVIPAVAGQVFDELLAAHLVPGSFGEFMNILSAIMINRVRIDKNTKTLVVYQADNVTPLKTYPLYDLNSNPALLNASERGKGV